MIDRFLNITTLVLTVKGKKQSLSGKASIKKTLLTPDTLLFEESGMWENGIAFKNIFKWSFEPDAIQLSHLRQQETPPFSPCANTERNVALRESSPMQRRLLPRLSSVYPELH